MELFSGLRSRAQLATISLGGQTTEATTSDAYHDFREYSFRKLHQSPTWGILPPHTSETRRGNFQCLAMLIRIGWFLSRSRVSRSNLQWPAETATVLLDGICS